MTEAKTINLNDIIIEENTNTRKTFKQTGLDELAASIRQKGVIQRITVKELPNGKYALIAGERRVRASFLAGKVTIPAEIIEVSETEHLEINLIENLQREALPYFETAKGIRRLRDEAAYNVDEIARKISKSKGPVYNYLKLTSTPPEVQEIFAAEEIVAEVAIMIAKRLDNSADQIEAAQALRREQKNKRVQRRAAESYLAETFGIKSVQPKTKRLTKNGNHQSEYISNWKKYLVRFDAVQFLLWRKCCAGRHDTETLAEAVEIVMREVDSKSAAN